MKQCWGHIGISYSPTVSLLQDHSFILCSVVLGLKLCNLCFPGSLVIWLPINFCQWEALQEDWRREERKRKLLLVFQFPSSSLQRQQKVGSSPSFFWSFQHLLCLSHCLQFFTIFVSGHISRVRLRVPEDRCKACPRGKEQIRQNNCKILLIYISRDLENSLG